MSPQGLDQNRTNFDLKKRRICDVFFQLSGARKLPLRPLVSQGMAEILFFNFLFELASKSSPSGEKIKLGQGVGKNIGFDKLLH